MKITFLGADKIVTGSCHLLEVNGKKILLDCGMFQGPKLIRDLNRKPFSFNPGEIDAVILSHAHIDHSGLLPRLIKEGFKGFIHCTPVTEELCQILLPDCGHIQESDAEYANRKGLRAGKSQVLPLFTVDDAYTALQSFYVHNFEEPFEVIPGVTAKLRVAGHILGSAVVRLEIEENGKKTTMIFSGDVGQPKQPIVEDPSILKGADFIVTESTYGNRKHKVYDKEAELANSPHEKVAGMLLYARTDEAVQPDHTYSMNGNKISVKTLDLNRPFDSIAAQLNDIVQNTFS